MTGREKITRDCIRQGDISFFETFNEILEYKKSSQYFTERESFKRKNLIASKIALSCEYYLKGIFMQEAKINLTEDMKKILMDNLGTDKLSEDEEIALLLDDDIKKIIDEDKVKYERLDKLSRIDIPITDEKGNIKKQKALKVLQNTLKDKTFRTIGHDLEKAMDALPETVQQKIYCKRYIVSPLVHKLIAPLLLQDTDNSNYARYIFKSRKFKIVRHEYRPKPLANNGSKPQSSSKGWIERCMCTRMSKDSKKILSHTEMKDAFPAGRYAITNNLYNADLKALIKFNTAIRTAIPQIINNAFYINRKNCIFPDKNSSIAIYDSDKNLIDRATYDRNNMSVRK